MQMGAISTYSEGIIMCSFQSALFYIVMLFAPAAINTKCYARHVIKNPLKIIMIDPAGDFQQSGGTLRKKYEHKETYACAEQLKEVLNQQATIESILTTYQPDKKNLPEPYNASQPNCLDVDLFIRIQICKEETEKPSITIYHLLLDPVCDKAKRPDKPFEFTPLHFAHIRNITKTETLCNQFKENLISDQYQSLFTVRGPYGLPLKPLVGISSPALLIEIGLNNDAIPLKTIIQALGKEIIHLFINTMT